MFDQIIVLMDGTDRDNAAVAHGLSEAARHGAGLVLMQVIPYPEPFGDARHGHGGPARQPTALDPELATAWSVALRRLRERARRIGPRPVAEVDCEIGDPHRRVLEVCGRYRRPLLVIGSSDGDGIVRHPMGPAVRQLIADGRVDVLVVHDGAVTPEVPLLPFELPGQAAYPV